MNKTIKKEFLPGGAKRQEMLDQVPNYLTAPGLQANKHMFCTDILGPLLYRKKSIIKLAQILGLGLVPLLIHYIYLCSASAVLQSIS